MWSVGGKVRQAVRRRFFHYKGETNRSLGFLLQAQAEQKLGLL